MQVNVVPERAAPAENRPTRWRRNRSNTSSTLSAGVATNPFDYSEDAGPDRQRRSAQRWPSTGRRCCRSAVQLSGILSYRSALPYSAADQRAATGRQAVRPSVPNRATRGAATPPRRSTCASTKIVKVERAPLGERVRRSVQRDQRGELRRLHRDGHVDAVRAADDGRAEAPDPTRIPARFLSAAVATASPTSRRVADGGCAIRCACGCRC